MAIDLERQVEQEQQELTSAPRVDLVHNSSGRCHFCGAVTRNLIFVERVGDAQTGYAERYKGEDCCG